MFHNKNRSFGQRSTLRGIKKCASCGHFNGNRAKGCKNKNCSLALNFNRFRQPILDAVELHSFTDTKIYSVRVLDKGADIRNFVKITDQILSSEENKSVISRNTICYVDTCKYDLLNNTNTCKHIKKVLATSAKGFILKIKEECLFAINLPNDNMHWLWKMYNDSQNLIPSVQRIGKYNFVVQCEPTSSFPAGFLHVSLTASDARSLPKLICSCKKIKRLPYDEFSLKNNFCDHLCLLMAAINSDNGLCNEFSNHVKLFTNMQLNKTNNDKMKIDDELLFDDNNEFILYSKNELCDNFEKEIDFSTEIELINSSHGLNKDFIDKDTSIKLVDIESFNDDNNSVSNNYLDNLTIIQNKSNTDSLELTDCQIELMDQFTLTDQIDLCNTEIELINNNILIPSHIDINNDSLINNLNNNMPMNEQKKTHKNSQESFVNSQKHGNDKSTNKPNIMRIHGNSITKLNNKKDLIKKLKNIKSYPPMWTPTIDFIKWLDSVIERINETMDFNDNGKPDMLIFSVFQEFFHCLNLRFSVGIKYRLPNSIDIIDEGKYTGLCKYTWNFNNLSLLRKIFKTEKMELQVERKFIQQGKLYVPLINETDMAIIKPHKTNNDRHHSKIKPNEIKTFLKIGPINKNDNSNVFKIEWIPDVLKKSHHGEMRIQFQYGHMKNNIILPPPI